VTRDELVVAFALARLDHPGLDLEEVAALVVRRLGPDEVVRLAAETLAARDELRGDVFAGAVEHVLRTVLRLRDGTDDRPEDPGPPP
jgi:chromatin segregation and condensation protein Rec8/ScpA/Scc1 (kleisin family)